MLRRLLQRAARRVEVLLGEHRGEQQPQPAEALQRLVVQLPGPAASLGVGGGQRAAQPVGLHALRERHGGRGADRERAQHLLVVLAEHAAVGSVVKRGEQTDRVAAVDHRHEQRGLSVRDPELSRSDPQTSGDIGDPFRAPAFEYLPGGRIVDRQAHTLGVLRVPGAGLHDQLIPVAQHDHEATSADERTAALDDQLEHVLKRYLPTDRNGHVARGLKAAEGFLELVAA